MKALTSIREKASAPFKALAKRFGQLEEAQGIQGKIGLHFSQKETARNDAIAAFYASPSVEAFDKCVEAQATYEASKVVWQQVCSSIGLDMSEKLTTTDEAREDLANALVFYAEEINAQIGQIEADARELADRAGIDYSEPPAVATMRNEYIKAREGVEACRNPEADAGIIWRTFAPMVKPLQKAKAN